MFIISPYIPLTEHNKQYVVLNSLKPKPDAIAMVMLGQFYWGGPGTGAVWLEWKIKITKNGSIIYFVYILLIYITEYMAKWLPCNYWICILLS